ncbi:unnamed protein product [Arabidopsis thaliana]|uniref:Aldehyde oxidase/xanthine dehydrogenase second molybdopterin binding domain-containing protein n=1 Tax=Arabidopsis thaliana TaxID=3702 RepID=A0A5S9S994_ARATH|nr:unnamed protein product [Arabidopsis thaliana]
MTKKPLYEGNDEKSLKCVAAGIRAQPESSSAEYLNYGIGASEVEVDLVTGKTEFIRSDIIYDCGKSLNPTIDLGQKIEAAAGGEAALWP